MVGKMDRYDRAMLKLDALAQGRYESPTTYAKRVWKLFLQVDEDEESWVVRKFINGIRDEEFWQILRAERNRNKTMGLGIAMKRLKALYRIAHETDYDPDSDSEDESEISAGESDSNSQFEETELPLSYLVVRTIPHYILSDQAAFNQFLTLRNSIPSFDCSGPFSQKAIEKLQAAHGQHSLVTSKGNRVAAESPMALTQAISLTPVDNRTSKDSTILDSGRKVRATDSALAIAFQNTRDTTMPVNRDLPAASNSEVESEQLVIRYRASDVTLAAAGSKPVVSDNADKLTVFDWDSTREKEEKWIEKYDVRKAVEKDWDASMMVSGMERRNYLQDLAGMAMNEGAEQEVDMVNRERTADERESSGGPHCSKDLTIDAIQNPRVLSIQTVSEWDPGPGKSTAQVDAQNTKDIVVKTMSREPVHPVVEYLWPPEFRSQQAYRRIPIPIRNTCVRKHYLLSRSPTRRAVGIGYTSQGNGGRISGNQRKSTQVVAETGISDCA